FFWHRARGLLDPLHQSVSHARAQISRSSCLRARFANESAPDFSWTTAKTVEPEPDINATSTSACFSSHVFNCARKTNFWKTGRSRSFTKIWPSTFCGTYEAPGISFESRQRE